MLKHTDAVIFRGSLQFEMVVGIWGGSKVTLVNIDTTGLDLSIAT